MALIKKYYGLYLAMLLLATLHAMRAGAQTSGDDELLALLNERVSATPVVNFAMEYGGYSHKKVFLRDFETAQADPDKQRLKDKMVFSPEGTELGYSLPIDLATYQGRVNYVGIRGPQILEQEAFRAHKNEWAGLMKRNYFGGIRFGMSRSEVVGILGTEVKDQQMLVVRDINDSTTVHFLFREGRVDGINLFHLSKKERTTRQQKTPPTATVEKTPAFNWSADKDIFGIVDLTPDLPENLGAPGLRLSFIRSEKDSRQNGLFLEAYCGECPGTANLEYISTFRINRIDTVDIEVEMGPNEIRKLLQGPVGTRVKVRFGSQIFPLIRNNYPLQKVTWKTF